LQVFSVGNIIGYMHKIPQIATGCKAGDGLNQRWSVNSHIDLVTSNEVYNQKRVKCILHTERMDGSRDFRSVTHCAAIKMQELTE
jgi:hypothetical protein